MLSGAVSLLVLDALWLGYLGKSLYQQELRSIARYVDGRLDFVLWAAAIVYIAILAGLLLFVWPKAESMNSAVSVFVTGGLFGMVTYAIYDYTNLAVLKGWSVKIAAIDVVWGFILCGTATLVMWLVNRAL
jgi:uncharacterized membrane protein